ncbi:Leucine-rich repeats and immunoglobulin-like domains protein 3, partial [Pseudolycoriella hygida]
MSAMLVYNLMLSQTLHSVECSTTIINASSQNITIPSYGNSQSTNQSTTIEPTNPIQIEVSQESVNSANRTNAETNKAKFERVTSKSVVKLYNKADSRKRKIERKSIVSDADLAEWHCPNISQSKDLGDLCSCDMPHTLRCSADIHTLENIAEGLRASPYTVSLLDCTLKNVSFLSNARIFENVSLHGLVISSGEIKRVHRLAFLGIKTPLQALGLPNNALTAVPWNSLAPLTSLDRLDLSNNKIKTLGASDFMSLQNLTYLELSDNQISSISLRTFAPLKKLTTLKLNGNRLGDFTTTLLSIGQSINLRELDLKSNSIKGPLTRKTLPALPALESLNLDRNLLSSIQNGALQTFPYLVTLSLRHNQIDVLQDHAFSGLSSLQALDLGYNGIVAVSGASLLHLSKLLVLDLTHNFLRFGNEKFLPTAANNIFKFFRALTSDLIAPLPSLRELRLDGNDISIVAKNALSGANELHSLSLQDNPLSCDCTLKPFAEWLTISKIPSQDLLGAICATPPHLEGAPLLQVPIDGLNCDGGSEYENSEVLEQLDIISKQSNLTYSKDLSDIISLKNVHLSEDYGIILTWSVNLRNDEFKCDAVFVYKETNVHEILLDNSP